MAKNATGGAGRKATGEVKAKRAPVRRRAPKTADAVASAPDLGAARTGPSSEDIARRAYELYLQRGEAPGSHLEDWYEAERQLKERG